MLGLRKYVTEKLPEGATQEDTTRQLQTLAILYNSTSAVHKSLTLRGWSYKDECPVELYKLIHEVVPQASVETSLAFLSEYTRLKFEDFDSMEEYALRLQYLKRRTTKLGYEASEAVHVALAMVGLAGYKQHDFLLRKLMEKTLSWASLIEELAAQVSRDNYAATKAKASKAKKKKRSRKRRIQAS